jgi:hypothetical protein
MTSVPFETGKTSQAGARDSPSLASVDSSGFSNVGNALVRSPTLNGVNSGSVQGGGNYISSKNPYDLSQAESWPVQPVIPDDATMTQVLVRCRCYSWSGIYIRPISLNYTIDGFVSWGTEGPVTNTGPDPPILYDYDVTGLVAWTPALCKAADTGARVTDYGNGQGVITTSVDYIGFYFAWTSLVDSGCAGPTGARGNLAV